MDIESLIDRMTLEEKVSMLTGSDWWHTRSIERLNIPALRMCDGPHGTRIPLEHNHARSLPATCFPTGVAMGSTWNPELIGRIGAALGREAKAGGCHILLGPCVNIHRFPLGGRNFESFSEDPFLSARLAVAYVRGVQNQRVGATIKHFALNNFEFERFTISSEIAERPFREIYLPAFEAAVREARPWAVMSAYNRINGTFASENKRLLTDILRGEWGFDGLVMSDWFAAGSTVGSALAGLDLEMPGPPRFYGDPLLEAVTKGEIDEEVIDEKVRRILRTIAKAGAFEPWDGSAPDSQETAVHAKLAREAANEAIVLLKNEGSLLPLDRDRLQSIAVVGPNAAFPRIQGEGSSRVTPPYAVSPLEGLKEITRGRIKLLFEQGCTNHKMLPLLDAELVVAGHGGSDHGLLGEYFNNNELAGFPALTRVDRDFVFRWGDATGGTPPGPGVDKDHFSIRWTGTFLAPKSGTYAFGLLTDGLGRIFLGDELVVDKWTEESEEPGEAESGERIGRFEMEAGRAYAIRVEYRQKREPLSPFRRIRLGCEVPLVADAMDRAAEAAAASDIVLVFAGLTDEYDTEGKDRLDMYLPGRQAELIRAVARANSNTVVILINGSPVAMDGWIEEVPAVLEAWYLGQESGRAIAGVLFGEVNPSGKLPETFPRRLEDTPAFLSYPGECGQMLYGEGLFVGYRYYDARKIEPMFPFGHGLSFTIFEYGNLEIHPAEPKVGDEVRIAVDVKNTGDRAGKEVVQLYVGHAHSSLARPVKELKGFRKICLEPGQSETVCFLLGEQAFAFYHPESSGWVVEPGEFVVSIGSSSRDIRASGTIFMKGPD